MTPHVASGWYYLRIDMERSVNRAGARTSGVCGCGARGFRYPPLDGANGIERKNICSVADSVRVIASIYYN